jgi:predicted TIM-barrel fold metal-dependent hydrolase
MVFGSDCPVQDPFSQLRVIETLTRDGPLGVNLSATDMEAIMGDNMARLLRLS